MTDEQLKALAEKLILEPNTDQTRKDFCVLVNAVDETTPEDIDNHIARFVTPTRRIVISPEPVGVVLSEVQFGDIELIDWSDPRVHTAPPEFNFETDGGVAKDLEQALLRLMHKEKGLGLSANQVGLPFKVFVMGTKAKPLACFNPMLVSVEGKCLMREGCLTYPGLFLTLERPATCVLSYQNAEGAKVLQEFSGLAARIVLHEYDHMLGIDYTSRASPFKVKWELDKLRKRLKKVVRQQKRLRSSPYATIHQSR